MNSSLSPKKLKFISGGQTGADRAALDWAIAHRVPHGGWCPQWRRAEDGQIPARYLLMETPSREYTQRTEWNIRDSDGTLIFSLSSVLSGGSAKTRSRARRFGKPVLHLAQKHRIRVLNVAGPRASDQPRIQEFVKRVLNAALLSECARPRAQQPPKTRRAQQSRRRRTCYVAAPENGGSN